MGLRSVKISWAKPQYILTRAPSLGSINRCVHSWYSRWKNQIMILPQAVSSARLIREQIPVDTER